MDPFAYSPHQTNEQHQSNVTQLEFRQAMTDFKTMFPNLDEDVIEMVLRSNQGAVDSTIDQLLQMTEENQNSKNGVPHNPPSYAASVHSNSSSNFPYDLSKNINSTPKEKLQNKTTLKQLESQLINFDSIDAESTAGATAVRSKNNLFNSIMNKKSSRFNPPLIGPLPNDFLRIQNSIDNNLPQSNQATANQLVRQSSNDHQVNRQLLKKKMEENERQRLYSNIDDKEAQFLEDERIAIMLQNEEFISELRKNQDFLTALNYDAMNHNTRVRGFSNENYTGATNNLAYDSSSQNFSDADFKERIKNMGKLSRKKFNQLAGLFSRRNKSGLPRDNLIGDDNYKTLENDYSDNEDYNQPINQKKSPHLTRH